MQVPQCLKASSTPVNQTNCPLISIVITTLAIGTLSVFAGSLALYPPLAFVGKASAIGLIVAGVLIPVVPIIVWILLREQPTRIEPQKERREILPLEKVSSSESSEQVLEEKENPQLQMVKSHLREGHFSRALQVAQESDGGEERERAFQLIVFHSAQERELDAALEWLRKEIKTPAIEYDTLEQLVDLLTRENVPSCSSDKLLSLAKRLPANFSSRFYALERIAARHLANRDFMNSVPVLDEILSLKQAYPQTSIEPLLNVVKVLIEERKLERAKSFDERYWKGWDRGYYDLSFQKAFWGAFNVGAIDEAIKNALLIKETGVRKTCFKALEDHLEIKKDKESLLQYRNATSLLEEGEFEKEFVLHKIAVSAYEIEENGFGQETCNMITNEIIRRGCLKKIKSLGTCT